MGALFGLQDQCFKTSFLLWAVSVWVFIFLIGFLRLAGERSHLLMRLLRLEVINLAIFVGFTMFGVG